MRQGMRWKFWALLEMDFLWRRQQENGSSSLAAGSVMPPMLEAGKAAVPCKADVTVVMGYRDQNLFLKEEFREKREAFHWPLRTEAVGQREMS